MLTAPRITRNLFQKLTDSAEFIGQSLDKRPYTIILSCLFLHAVIWSLLSWALASNLPLDSVESLYWGHEWQLGYFKHPPVTAWMAEAAVLIFGRHDFVIYALSLLCTSLAILPIALYICEKFGGRAGVFTCLLALATHFTTLSAVEYNVNMGFLPFWSWMAYAFLKAQESNKLAFWVLLAIVSTLGVMAKYTAGILLIVMLAWVLLGRRDLLREKGPYIAAGLFVVLMLPHLIWLYNDDFGLISYAFDRAGSNANLIYKHLWLPTRFLLDFVYSIAPMLLVMGVSLGYVRLKKIRIADTTGLIGHIRGNAFLFISFASVAFIFAMSLLLGAKIKSIWSMPLGVVFSGALGILMARFGTKERDGRFIKVFAVVYLILIIVYAAIMLIAPLVKKYPKRMLHDGPALGEIVDQYWQQHSTQPLKYIIGIHWPAGSAAWYAKDRPIMFEEGNIHFSPWVDEARLHKSGAMYVSYGELTAGEEVNGLCVEDPKHVFWPAAYGVHYKKHPKVWLAYLAPKNGIDCKGSAQ
ncbi:glycosyltransferase family 39 protein [Polycladidibacter stylochi]|uniref:glycosyltransferase family 39 protein n=1 Tax=Polycladidibacter stylochi TaxID=1807766 RepID=UPI00082F953A|nr:glycosyltransferase family 39 protein [Pseudovibrio stylochi]